MVIPNQIISVDDKKIIGDNIGSIDERLKSNKIEFEKFMLPPLNNKKYLMTIASRKIDFYFEQTIYALKKIVKE